MLVVSKILLAAYINFPPQSSTPSPVYYARIVKSDDDGQEWKEAAKSAMKKFAGRYNDYRNTIDRQNTEEASRQLSLTEARKVAIKQDENLPAAVRLKVSDQNAKGVTPRDDTVAGTRVKVVGHTRGILLCIFSGPVNIVAPILFQKQASLEIYGETKEVPAENKAPGDRELHVDFYSIISEAPGGPDSFTSVVPISADQAGLPDFRHLVLRRPEESMVMKARASALTAFRQYYKEHDMRESTAPSFVQTQVEGGGSLFSLEYYGACALLTQTSQLYLETQLPNSHTRRHLSEYTDIEGELDFIVFEDLLQHIEDLLCGVINTLLAEPESAGYIHSLITSIKASTRPFMRMRYADAIEWLNEHKIATDEGESHAFGTDISEAAERAMTDQIAVAVMLTHFPVPLKAFYIKKDATDPRVTESVDVLVPGVGEVVDSGMRMDNYEELLEVMKENGRNLASCSFYLDQRKCGASSHDGYGMSIERFLAWILKRHTVRECVPFPNVILHGASPLPSTYRSSLQVVDLTPSGIFVTIKTNRMTEWYPKTPAE
ncbi:asparaginyl-tRNA synthetase [Usnea florida]